MYAKPLPCTVTEVTMVYDLLPTTDQNQVSKPCTATEVTTLTIHSLPITVLGQRTTVPSHITVTPASEYRTVPSSF